MKTNKIWFRRKKYGYGWVPATWEGWLCIGLFIASVIISTIAIAQLDINEQQKTGWQILTTTCCAMLLVYVSYKKGEPARWSWGD